MNRSDNNDKRNSEPIAASLVATLQAKGPYTVFAPSNAAFEALPAGTLDALL